MEGEREGEMEGEMEEEREREKEGRREGGREGERERERERGKERWKERGKERWKERWKERGTERIEELRRETLVFVYTKVHLTLFLYCTIFIITGDAMAALMLGNLYAVGTRLVPVDETRAIYYLNISAQARNAAAAGQLGYLLAKQYHRARRYPPHSILQAQHVSSNGGNSSPFAEAAAAAEEEAHAEMNGSGGGASGGRRGQRRGGRGHHVWGGHPSANQDSVDTFGETEGGGLLGAATSMSAAHGMTAREYHYALSCIDPAEVLRLLQFAARKGDANGIVGLGFAHYMGIGAPANLTSATEQLLRALPSHMDAGFWLGEIHMGQEGPSGDPSYYKIPTPGAYPTSERDGEVSMGLVPAGADFDAAVAEAVDLALRSSGGSSKGTQASGSSGSSGSSGVGRGGGGVQGGVHMRMMPSIDVNAAMRAYHHAAQLGNVLAQHRLAHIAQRGMGMQVCVLRRRRRG